MTVTMKLYTFAKDENSTKTPTGSSGTQYTGILVEPCTVLNPIIKLNGVNAYSYNYAYVQEFGRYYFIVDWETIEGFWYIHCKVDVMASFKSTIGSSTQYVLRAHSAQNEYIVDTMFPPTGQCTKTGTEIKQNLTDALLENGTFVLNITGSADATVGSYMCGWSTFKNVISEMLLTNDDNTLWGANLSKGIRNAISQPFKHLGNVIWIPDSYSPTTGTTTVTSITLGNTTLTSTPAKPLTFYYTTAPLGWTSSSITLPKHPQASTYGKYMNLKPYTQYIYSDDSYGLIELDPLKLIDTTTFTVGKVTDPATGTQILQLPDGQSRTAQIGVMISMENNSLNLGGILSSVAHAAVAAATDNPIAMASSIVGATESLIPTISSCPQTGSTVTNFRDIYLYSYFWNSVGHDTSHKGNAYCATKQISTLSGYILTSNAHIENSIMSATEQEMIVNFMDSGFYYE